DVQSHVRTSGPVLSVSDNQPPSTLSIELPFGGPQPLRLTPDTEMPNTDPGTDLQTFQGTFVWVEYDPTTLEIATLLPLLELQRLHGRIDAVDPESASITVSDATQSLTLQVQPFLEDFGAITLDFQ